MLDVVQNYVKQKTLCNSVGTVLLKKALVEVKIWQLMEVVNRQKRIPNQPVQFLVVMGDARQSLGYSVTSGRT